LRVYLTNGEHLNASNSFKREIGEQAMKLVYNSIENKENYTRFTVYFVVEKEYGGEDMRSENPFPYKIEDLE